MPTSSSTLDQLVARNSELRRRSEELEQLLKEQEELHQKLMVSIWQSQEILDRLSVDEAAHQQRVKETSNDLAGTCSPDA